MAGSRRVIGIATIIGLLLLPGSASAAITLSEGPNTVSTPRFELNFGDTLGAPGDNGRVERVDGVRWKNSAGTLGANITAPGLSAFCGGSGPGHFWGQSFADHDGGSPVPVMDSSFGDWKPAGSRTVELNTVISTGVCAHTPTIPVRTRYSFYDSAGADGSIIRVERRWAFAAGHLNQYVGTHGLRAYVPRVPVGTYDQVIYPKANETGLITTSSAGPAFSTDWNSKWVALNASGGASANSGILLLRDPTNSSPATVVTDNDGGSNSNLSSVTLLRPANGWSAPLTEIEYVCFYDAASWPVNERSATRLPDGCSVRGVLPVNTSVPTVSGGAVGNPLPGTNLTASPGTWENVSGPFSYQWLRCTGASCTEIGGATSQNYTTSGDDFGSSIRVRVTAESANGEEAFAQSTLAGSISGSVYEGTVSTPLSGARVQACLLPSGSCRTATTDGNGDYHLQVPQAGNYELKAFPPASSNAVADTDQVTVVTGTEASAPNLILQVPQAPPASVGVTGPGFRGTAPGGVPVVHWNVPFSVRVHVSAPPPGTQVEAKLETPDGDRDPVDEDFEDEPETPDPDDGTWEFEFPSTNPLHGNGFIRITIIPPTPEEPDGEIIFPVYIDPSGYVRTTDGTALPGATVTLFRSDFPGGPFTVVPDGSAVMSPSNRANPDTSDATGHFGWDVVAGYYKVRAQKAGCHAPGNASQAFVDTSVMEIPPPVTNLDIRLDCPAPAKPPDPDTSPPDTAKGKGPAKKIKKPKATFNFSSEPGATFTCQLDKKPAAPCTSPRRVKKLKEGKHKFTVTATDSAGNADPSPVKWSFKVE